MLDKEALEKLTEFVNELPAAFGKEFEAERAATDQRERDAIQQRAAEKRKARQAWFERREEAVAEYVRYCCPSPEDIRAFRREFDSE